MNVEAIKIESQRPVESVEKKNISEKKHFSKNYIIFGSLGFVVIIFFLIILLFLIKPNAPQTVPGKPTPTPFPVVSSITPQVSPVLQEINIYSINSTSISKIARILPEKGFQGQSPILDASGNIYYVDQNRVMQFSLKNQDAKVIYTNTKPYTKISNVTFLAPADLYISIILDSFDPNYTNQPDHNSYVIEMNVITNTIRTIGPLPILTYGYISYLMSAQDADIINIVKESYCKGEGEIYKYSSGSALFITKDGFGCNGSDPYLLGTIGDTSKLVLASPGNNTAPDDFVSAYGNLYTINVTNGNTDSIFDLNSLLPTTPTRPVADMPNQINKFSISEDQQTIFYLLGTKVYSINIANRNIAKITDVSQLNGYIIIAIANNKIYLLNSYKESLAIVDIATNNIATYSQQVITNATTATIKYLGLWNNQLLFYIAQVAQ